MEIMQWFVVMAATWEQFILFPNGEIQSEAGMVW